MLAWVQLPATCPCQGDYTALVSEPLVICGVDVAAPQQLRRRPGVAVRQAIAAFENQFSKAEVRRWGHWAGRVSLARHS